MKKSDDELAQIAATLGMKQSEITEVVLDADGVLVQTHDGVWTLIRDDGELVHRVPGPAPDQEPVDELAKPAAKRRSRS